jgi:hypothetical protein
MAASMKFRVFWDILLCSQIDVDRHFRGASIIRVMIALMMEAAHSSETSVHIYLTTRQYIPEDSVLHTARMSIILLTGKVHWTLQSVTLSNWWIIYQNFKMLTFACKDA